MNSPVRQHRRRRWITVGMIVVLGIGILEWWQVQPDPFGFVDGPRLPLGGFGVPDPSGVPVNLRGADRTTRGHYLALAADCAACHTVSGHAAFSGGNAFKLPIGTIYAPNITSDHSTGIGAWSDADFLRAMHEGVDAHGKHLYPAFPYASFTYLSDADVLDIKAYLFSLPPVHDVAPENTLIFPFNQRWILGIWSFINNPNRRFETLIDRSPRWNRGAYLTEALAHCGECHTPRNLILAMNNRQKFQGTMVGGWRAFNITPDLTSGIGAWTDDELADYLARGHALGHGTAAGPMAEAVDKSLQFLSRSDIDAMVEYLRSIPPRASDSGLSVRRSAASAFPDRRVDPKGDLLGQHLFAGACVGCHAWSGAGAMLPYAQLTGAAAVNDVNATNVVEVILNGVERAALPGEPAMPAFANEYSDTEIAALANYVTLRFGRTPSKVSGATVAKLRSAGLD